MSDGITRSITRRPGSGGSGGTELSNTVTISGPAQMPLTLAADGNMRWHLALGTKYIINGSFEIPLIALPEITIPGTTQAITLIAVNQNDAFLFNGSDIPHIWGRNNGSFVMRTNVLIDISNSGAGVGTVLFDLVGSSPATSVVLDNVVFLLFKSLGNIVNSTLDTDSATMVSCSSGLTLNNGLLVGGASSIGFTIFNPFGVPAIASMFSFVGAFGTMSSSIGNIQQQATDSAFFIDSAATGNFDLIGNSFDGVGNFFAPVIDKPVTLFATADVTVTGFSDSSVNPGVDTTVVFSGITDVVLGQTVLIADEAAYDGLHTVVRVASDQLSFDIAIAHSTSGTGVLKRTQVTSVGNFLVRNQTHTISGTTAYNGTQQVSKIVDVDNFLIPVAFATGETIGTLSSSSKTQDSVGVMAALNGVSANSTVIAEAILNTNVLVTDIPLARAIVIVNATTWTSDVAIRMTVSTDGTTEYTGTVPDIRLKVDGNVTLEPSSSTKNVSCQIARCDTARHVVTFTNGANTVDETSTALINGDALTFNGNAGTLPAALRADVIYYVVGQATNNFQLAYTPGGSVIAFADDGSGTNTYAAADLHGSKPANAIAANNPRTLVPQALVSMNSGDKIFMTVSNNDDAVDIAVSKAYYRNFI